MSEIPLGLRENPFRAGHHPKYVFASREHQEALAHLRYGIQNREPFVLITGEVGTGKTTAVYDALAEWGSRAVVALITNPARTRSELLEEICLRFGVAAAAPLSKPHALVQLERQLSALRARGELAILLLDEAQNLDRELLEEIRLLSNLEVQGEKLIQIFLIGQPELEAKLAQPELRQLRQRIGIHYRIQPLGAAESTRYIHHRVAAAGGNPDELFTADACAEIFRITNGIPREINVVAGQALLNAFVEDARSVTVEHVHAVEREIEFRSVLGRGPEAVELEPGLTLPEPTAAEASDATPMDATPPDDATDAEAPHAPTPGSAAPDAVPPGAEQPGAEPPPTELPYVTPRVAETATRTDASPMAPATLPGTPVLRAAAWPDFGMLDTRSPIETTPYEAVPASETSVPEPAIEPRVGPEPAVESQPAVERVAAMEGPPPPGTAPPNAPESASQQVAAGGPVDEYGGRAAEQSGPVAEPPAAEQGGPAADERGPILPSWFDQVFARRAEAEEQTAAAGAAPPTVAAPAPTPAETTSASTPDLASVPATDASLHDEGSTPASASLPPMPPVPTEAVLVPDGPVASTDTLSPRLREKLAGPEEPARSRWAGLGLLIVTMVIATAAIGSIVLVRFGPWTRQAPRLPGASSPASAASGQSSAPVAPPAAADSTTLVGSTGSPIVRTPSPRPAGPSGTRTASTGAVAQHPSESETMERQSSSLAAGPAAKPAAGAAAVDADPVPRTEPMGRPPAPGAGTAPDAFGIAVGTYLSEGRALAQRTSLSRRTPLPSRVIVVADDNVSMYRVVMGAFGDRGSAERAASDLVRRGLVTEARVIPLAQGAPAYR